MKIAIVTGASSGIGKAAAIRLAAKGLHVMASVRREADAKAWAGVSNVQPFFCDVADEASVSAGLKSIQALLEKAEVVHLVNNAGIAVAGPIEAVPIARWKDQFEVNVFGLLRATQAFLPFIRKTRGRIVNISSVSGLATSPYLGPYSSSKFAVEAISDALRRELKQHGCKVVVVEPGPIATPIWEKGLAKKDILLQELPPHLQAVYSRELAIFQKGVAKSARDAVPVDRVSDIIETALLSPRPRVRYVVGPKGVALQMAIVHHLPESWTDAMISRRFAP